MTKPKHPDDRDGLTEALRRRLLDTGSLAPAHPPEGAEWVLVPREPTEAMLRAAFVAMNETPSGTWKRMKAEGVTPRKLFDVKMAPRWRAMIDAAPRPPSDRAGPADG